MNLKKQLYRKKEFIYPLSISLFFPLFFTSKLKKKVFLVVLFINYIFFKFERVVKFSIHKKVNVLLLID